MKVYLLIILVALSDKSNVKWVIKKMSPIALLSLPLNCPLHLQNETLKSFRKYGNKAQFWLNAKV